MNKAIKAVAIAIVSATVYGLFGYFIGLTIKKEIKEHDIPLKQVLKDGPLFKPVIEPKSHKEFAKYTSKLP